MDRPSIDVAVVMARRPVEGPNSRWATHQWHLQDVVLHEAHLGEVPQLMSDDSSVQVWLHPKQTVELFKDTAEGYYLNLTSPEPCFWVMWRMEDEPGERAPGSPQSECIAYPSIVTLSYHDAGRWLDSQEHVEQVAAPKSVIEWLQAFTEMHHVQEEKRRKRPQSFLSLEDRFGNPARISTGEKRR